MKKVLRLSESELIGLVSKILNEKKGADFPQKQFQYSEKSGSILLYYGNQSDIDDAISLLMENRENIVFFSIMDCRGFVDFSGIDMCELPKIQFVGLKRTKNNFEELFDCYEKLGDYIYDLAKPDPPYFKDDRLADVPEPRFSMNESVLNRLVKKIIK